MLPPGEERVAPAALLRRSAVFDDLLVLVFDRLVCVGKTVAPFPDADVLGGSDMPCLQLAACPWMTPFAGRRVEGFGFCVLLLVDQSSSFARGRPACWFPIGIRKPRSLLG